MSTASTERLLAGAARGLSRTPFKRPSGRASFPRRVTLDLDDERYEWLKEQVWESRVPGGIAGLLRATIDEVASDDDLLIQILSRL